MLLLHILALKVLWTLPLLGANFQFCPSFSLLNPERYPVTSDLSQDTRGLPAQRGGYLSLAQISLMLAPALTLSDFLFLAV